MFLPIFNLIWKGKFTISASTLLASIFIVFYSLSIPNIYKSHSILAPKQISSNNNGALNSFSSLVGINLNSAPSSATDEAIALIRSFKFFEEKLIPNIFLPNLLAIEEWDRASGRINYNNSIYDVKNSIWVRSVKPPKNVQPSNQESFRAFQQKFSISKNDENGFVTLTINHQSPVIAQKWNKLIVDEINELTRNNVKLETLKAIDFLNNQILQTSLSEVKGALVNLLQEESKKLMLIESNPEYIFKIIDPPFAPELKTSPNRALICIIGAIIGFVFGIFIVLIKSLKEEK